MERRVLLAALLAGLVLVLWSAVFGPERPETIPEPMEVVEEPTRTIPPTPPRVPVEEERPQIQDEVAAEAIRGEAPEVVAVHGNGWSAAVNTGGAVLQALVLEDYLDSEGEQLDLIGETEVFPLMLAAKGPWNSEPYRYTRQGDKLLLEWSDGSGNWVEKEIGPGSGRYLVHVAVRGGGWPVTEGVVLGSGINKAAGAGMVGRFGRGGAVGRVNGKVERQNLERVKDERRWHGQIDFAGVDDQYFLLALLPSERLREVRLEGPDQSPEGVGRVVAVMSPAGLVGDLYGGPKQHHKLKGYGRGLEGTISFGIMGFFSVGFLAALRWIYSWAGNWGLAIIFLTAAIRVPLFPLTHKSTVAMRRMQALKPKMDAIQERYKERAKKDPQVRNRMNQEVMALYKQEGVNPLGGCLPTLVQLPILWALYTLFAYAIELRQAPFLLWVQDLSLRDPFYVLPVLMMASMFLQQRLAPQVGDPAQRRMFMMMPLIFGIMFMSFPAGLVLYWLVNNVLTIGQQLLTQKILKARAQTA